MSYHPQDFLLDGGDRTLTWRGQLIWKNPVDLFIYAEIVHELRPTLVIETGTHEGGSALFWRDMMALNDIPGEVFSIDTVEPVDPPDGDEFTFITGSSLDPHVVDWATDRAAEHEVVLLNLDSNHHHAHVLAELRAYAPLAEYVIVEDGIDELRYGRKGALTASRKFLASHPEFVAERQRERLGITNCPEGFLLRVLP